MHPSSSPPILTFGRCLFQANEAQWYSDSRVPQATVHCPLGALPEPRLVPTGLLPPVGISLRVRD